MVNYFLSGVKYLQLKLFGRNIIINGIPVLGIDTEVKAKKGNIELGHKVSSKSNVHIVANEGGKIVIKDLVFFNHNCIVVSKGTVKIGKGTIFGPNVSIFDHNHKFNNSTGVLETMSVGSINIGDNCWIGSGAIILKGADIGDGCIIGAGAIVSETIPPHSIVTMNRELTIKSIDDLKRP